jgi:hypothetical protein
MGARREDPRASKASGARSTASLSLRVSLEPPSRAIGFAARTGEGRRQGPQAPGLAAHHEIEVRVPPARAAVSFSA